MEVVFSYTYYLYIYTNPIKTETPVRKTLLTRTPVRYIMAIKETKKTSPQTVLPTPSDRPNTHKA